MPARLTEDPRRRGREVRRHLADGEEERMVDAFEERVRERRSA
jgi:hypothetical protein